MIGSIVELVRAEVTAATRVRFPSPFFQKQPVEFFRKVLGVEPWAKQIEVIEMVRDHDRVAVASGHKIGKSNLAAGLALWFYCSYEDARAILSSTTSRQVDQILWRELMMMRARSGRCVQCKHDDPDGLIIKRPCPHSAMIEGDLGMLARTGLKSDDFREVVGFTAREAEAVQGVSGRNLLYILDEASGIPDAIFDGVEGNRAGGAKALLLGNPTRNEGEFFEAFYSKSAFYKTIRISSEESPNVVANRIVIPGLATREWIEAKREEWGEDSPLYRVRVKGQHALNESGRIFNLHTIALAEQRWHDTPEAGLLFIGLDPAGESGTGDECMFAMRRGLKLLALRGFRGLTEEQTLIQLLVLIAEFKLPRETPVVVLDREGAIGNKILILLRAYEADHTAAFRVTTVRASDGAIRKPKIYDRLRDELVGNLEQWFRDGGAIVEDVKLEKELHTLEWSQTLRGGRLKATDKKAIRKLIQRSPDRLDALALSVWEPSSLVGEDDLSAAAQHAIAAEVGSVYAGTGFDPYAGADTWRR